MISVLLPVYNGEKYLREAIDSVLNQTFREFELIILNDGSTDNTEIIIKSYTDERIRYYKLEHQGLPTILNFGLREAKYNVIARMDADDICDLSRLEKQLKFLQNNPSIDLVGANVILFQEQTNQKAKINLPEYNEHIKEQLPRKCCIAHPTIMFRKQIVTSIGGYNVKSLVEDWELYLRLIDKISFYNLQDYLLFLRKHNNNLSYNKKFSIAQEELIKSHYLMKCNSFLKTKEIAKANFDIGYFYYLRDDEKFKQYFEKAWKIDKINFRYLYFLVVGKYFRILVLFARKSRLMNLLLPLKKLDKNNLLFRSNF